MKQDTLKLHPNTWTESFSTLIPEIIKQWNQLV